MGVATGCGFKEVYRFPHSTYPYSSCICSFLQQHPTFCSLKKMFFVLLEERRGCQIVIFYFALCLRKLRYYRDDIHSFDWKSALERMVVFKMGDSVPSARYSRFVMYCVYATSRSSLLIESTDSMMH